MKVILNLCDKRIQDKLAEKIALRVQTAMINYSELQDKGRFFSGVDFRHFVHEVLPSVTKSVIEDFIEQEENI